MIRITVASGKGGTGKTFLSTNLSSLLAEKHKVALIDLDVEEPNSGLFINADTSGNEICYSFKPEWDSLNCTMCGKCRDVCNFNAIIKLKDSIMVFPELCHSCYACSELCPVSALPMKKNRIGELKHYSKGNLEFVESILDIGQEQAVPLISFTNEYASENFNDRIIINDSPPGTACPAVEATKNADHIILVTEPTPFGLNDLKLIVNAMRVIGRDFSVVINRYGSGNDDTEDFCDKENIRIIGRIPDNRLVAEYYSEGTLVYDKIPAVRTELEKIGEFILNRSIIK